MHAGADPRRLRMIAKIAMTDFDHSAEIYSKEIEKSIGMFGQSHDFFVRNKASILLKALSGIGNPAEMKLLDVGCGTGLVHPYLAGHVRELHGVDVSEKSLSVARENNSGARLASYDGSRLPYEDGEFDCAYAICVLHHVPVPQWQPFMDELARVIKRRGMVVVIEHNPLNPATQWVVRTCALDDDAVLLWPRRLRQLFARTGLQDVDVSHVGFTPFGSAFFRRLDTALARIPLGTQYVMHGRRTR